MCLELQGSESPVIEKALAEAAARPGGPNVIAFMCMWSEFTALDTSGPGPAVPSGVQLVPLPCAGRLELVHVVDAILRGIDGVIVATCPEDECRQEKRGPRHAAVYEAKLERLLAGIGLSGRVARFTATPKRPGDFARDLKLNADRMRALGPLALSEAQREELSILKDLLSDLRMRWLLSREGDMLEKGNVYGEKVSPEQWNAIFDNALRDRRVQHAILRRARGGPVTAGEIASSLGLPPPVVVRHIIDLKRQNLQEMCHGQGPQKFAVKGGCH
jgi:coenzyme F420-reducing hydrogenase delta subunit